MRGFWRIAVTERRVGADQASYSAALARTELRAGAQARADFDGTVSRPLFSSHEVFGAGSGGMRRTCVSRLRIIIAFEPPISWSGFNGGGAFVRRGPDSQRPNAAVV
jgi:hypothetical protein